MRPKQVEFSEAGPLQGISGHSRRTGIRVTVVIVIAPGRFRVGGSRVGEEPNSKIQIPGCVDGSEKIEPMPLIVIRPGPLAGQIIVVRRKRVDADGSSAGGIIAGY